eukprot:g27401.t1
MLFAIHDLNYEYSRSYRESCEVLKNRLSQSTALQNMAVLLQFDKVTSHFQLWNTFHPPELVRPSLEKSLKLLKFDYIDLYIIELPLAFKPGDVFYPCDESGKYLYHPTDLCATWE